MKPLIATVVALCTVLFPIQGIAIETESQEELRPKLEPIKRAAAKFPHKCVTDRFAHTDVFVILLYDISDRGRAANIRVAESNNNCYEQAAIRSMNKWRFPKLTDENSDAIRKNIRITINFLMDGDETEEEEIQTAAAKELVKVAKSEITSGDNQGAIDRLNKYLEENEGNTSRQGYSAIILARAVAKANAGDLDACLADLYLLERYEGLPPSTKYEVKLIIGKTLFNRATEKYETGDAAGALEDLYLLKTTYPVTPSFKAEVDGMINQLENEDQ